MEKKLTQRQKAERVELDLKKYAGVIRNLIMEGKTIDEAIQDERATFWIETAKRNEK